MQTLALVGLGTSFAVSSLSLALIVYVRSNYDKYSEPNLEMRV